MYTLPVLERSRNTEPNDFCTPCLLNSRHLSSPFPCPNRARPRPKVILGVPRWIPYFGRTFLRLNYIYKRTYSYQKLNGYGDVTREKCGLLAVPRTVPVQHNVLPLHCACPSLSRQPSQAIRRPIHAK